MDRMNIKNHIGRAVMLLVCLMTLSIICAAAVLAEEPAGDAAKGTGVSYVDRSWDYGAKQLLITDRITDDSINVQSVPDSGSMTSGWYYLDRNVTRDGRVESIRGDVHLILGDGFKLDVKGLYVPPGSTLTIYGQSEGTGMIYSHPSGGAGIGGYSKHDNGNIVIKGGTINAVGHDHCAGIGSNDDQKGGYIEIYGGTITARGGGDGAGIGGGRDCDGGKITIYGGTIKANEDPNENAAAIGGGDDGNGGTITIWGGDITAWSRDGAGIGGGADGEAGSISINGGNVTVWDKGQGNGARIGSGDNASGGTITINDGKVTVYHRDGAGIGCAEGAGSNECEITINGGEIWAWDRGEANGAGIGGGNNSFGGTININGGKIHSYYRDGAGIGGGENRGGGDITIKGGEIYCNVGEGSEGNGAGIGGGNNGSGGDIDIYGGSIGIKGKDGAGIGGGDDGDGGNINIYDGSIFIDFEAGKGGYGTGNGAGIGGGNHGNGGNITIHDGSITIYADDAAGIGGGREDDTFLDLGGESGYGGNITINGGRLRITSYYAYAIGAGGPSGRAGTGDDPFEVFTSADIGDAGNIKITGGYIELQGNAGAAAIGGDEGDIQITGGTITPIMHARHQYTILLMNNGKVDISGGKVDGRMIRAEEKVSITGGSHSFSRILEGKRTIETDDLTLGDDMMVKFGTGQYGHLEEKQELVPAADRIKKLTDKGDYDLWTTVKVCDHPGITYTANADTHTAHCDHCRTAFSAESHEFKHDICTVCGYVRGDYTVSFDPDNGDEPYSVAVYSGTTVTRPAEDPAKDRYFFQGWHQVLSTKPEILAEEAFDFDTPVTANMSLKAVWSGHDWSEPVYEWASDNSSVTATRVARDDSSIIETETAATASEVTKEATCTEKGLADYTAVFSNAAFETQTRTGVEISELGHEPAAEFVIDDLIEATCRKGGSYDRVTVCGRCGDELARVHVTTPALGHDFVDVEGTAREATCTEAGREADQKCTRCGSEISGAAIPARGHDWGEWNVTQEASETEAGEEKRVCSNDPEHFETRVIPVLEHVHRCTKVEAKDAGCTESGNIACYVCDQGDNPCGRYFVDDPEGTITINVDGQDCHVREVNEEDTVIPAGHNWEESIIIAEPGCTSYGIRIAICADCGKVREETIDWKGHYTERVTEIIREATCEQSGYHWEVVQCSVCKEIMTKRLVRDDAAGHVWDEGVVTRKATGTEGGIMTYTCTVCGAARTEVIPPTGEDDPPGGGDDPAPAPDPSGGGDDPAPAPDPSGGDDTTPSDDTGPADDSEEPDAVVSSSFSKLQLRSTKQTGSSVTLTWKKLKGAETYVIYGNKYGKNNKLKKLGESAGRTKKITKILGKRLKKGTYYKFKVVALDKDDKKIAESKIIYAAPKGGKGGKKYGNHKRVAVKKAVIAKAKKLKKGRTLKLNAKGVKALKLTVKKIRKICYESSDPEIASVSSKGVIKGKSKGSCYIYAYAQNGVFRKIKVVVR